MFSDSHIHTWFSGDSDTDPEKMIKRAIELNMQNITITDHIDFDFPIDNLDFTLDVDDYFTSLSLLKSKYSNEIEVLIGIESGLEPDFADRIRNFVLCKPFDFVIGSSHIVNRMDPYSPDFFKVHSERQGFEAYFNSILSNLKVNNEFDVYGHIDYIVRYSPNKNANYSYFDYSDLLDEILKTLIDLGKGIEINTAGFKYGLNAPNPEINIIKKYKELGGEIITIGSDAHVPKYVGFYFNEIKDILNKCDFKHYNIFRNRKPVSISLY